MKSILHAIPAGALIALSCFVYTRVQAPLNAFVFAFGLLAICENGWLLYTGKVGSSKDIKYLLLILCGNFIGAVLVVLLLASSCDVSAIRAVGAAKAAQPVYAALVKSVFCGALMQIGVSAYPKSRLVTVGAVAVFLLCGFEHSVANMAWLLLVPIWRSPLILLTCIIGNAIGAKAIYAAQKGVEKND